MHPETIGGSDHRLVALVAEGLVQMGYRFRFGKVTWAKPDNWTVTLQSIEPTLHSLAQAVMSASMEMLQHQGVPEKKKRAVIEAAAWAREALYCLGGHACDQVSAHPAKKQ